MAKSFNTNGPCFEDIHYMVNMDSRVKDIIQNLVEKNKYFVINRPRQFGKTTLFDCLFRKLKEKYVVFWLSFEGMGSLAFSDECLFCRSFLRLLRQQITYGMTEGLPDITSAAIDMGIEDIHFNILMLKDLIIRMCMDSDRQIILMIDEVDKASDNQVFLDFLSVLRNMYLSRRYVRTFHSVILAGVYDIKNLKAKLRPDEEKRYNSPWNVAADFMVDMSFSVDDIVGMLQNYESDHHTGMDILDISHMLWDYTEGYPFMVSRICQILDEQTAATMEEAHSMEKAHSMEEEHSNGEICSKKRHTSLEEISFPWNRTGILRAVNHLLSEKNTLFDDMNKKITDSSSLKKVLQMILFHGKKIPYDPDDYAINLGTMFGYLKNIDKNVAISNRIFETRLYNGFLSEHMMEEAMFDVANLEKDTFVHNGVLDMDTVMKKFMEHFTEIYADSDDNLLSFNFNKNKKVGIKEIHCNGKVIVEVVV